MCDLLSVTFGNFLLHLGTKFLHFWDIGLHIILGAFSTIQHAQNNWFFWPLNQFVESSCNKLANR